MTRAPELIGDTWFGIPGARLSISDFKKRFLLLDFWTLCCVNCHHVLAELRPIEKKFSDVLTVVGVHSPKFEYEKLPESVAAAIARHEIEHPVLNDPNMTTWQSYAVRAWPTLVLIDPNGVIIATYSGEGHAHAIEALLEEKIPEYEAKGELIRAEGFYAPSEPVNSVLKQPGKVVKVPDIYRELCNGAEILVSNSGGHNLLGFKTTDLSLPVFSVGSGLRGQQDGNYLEASFGEPYGAIFLESDIANQISAHLLIADTANHLIRAVNLQTQQVSTIAGTGKQWMQKDPTEGLAREINISTPWDIEYLDGALLIAMAGEHRIWIYDFATKKLDIFAGTTNEGLVDGPLAEAWFAQPSGLVSSKVTPGKIWVVDAETSSLRYAENGKIVSQIGQGLFDFGHLDGPADQALLQHPLGVFEMPDGNVLIADTYNRAIRKFSPDTNQVTTIARDLSEPSDVEVIETATGPRLVVVETSANRISLLPIETEALVAGAAMRTARAQLDVSPGELIVDVTFTAPPKQKLDDRFGPASYLVISSTPKNLLLSGAGNSVELQRRLVLNPEVSEGVLHVAAKGASCDISDESAQCHIHQQDWGIPLRQNPTGVKLIELVLSGDKST